MNIFAVLLPAQSQAQPAVASNVEQGSSVGASAVHLIWVLTEGSAVASEARALALPGSQGVMQYEIACKNGELASVTRSYAAIGYGRQVWSIRVKGGAVRTLLRSALAPICTV